jgi:mono/diheme cytochrome c family protein
MNKLVKISVALTIAASLFSCGRDANNPGTEYAPDMYVSEAYEPYTLVEKNKFNELGINMRQPVAKTIARGKMPYHISKDSLEYAAVNVKNPLVIADTAAVLAQGELLYARFCQHCHGSTGQGDGPVGQIFKGVPAYNKGAVKDASTAHIFHVITKGKGRMNSHASQIEPLDRWKIAMYVNVLQKQ